MKLYEFKKPSPFDMVEACKYIASCKLGYSLIVESSIRVSAPKRTSTEFFTAFGMDFSKLAKVTCVKNARCYDYAAAVSRAANTPFESGEMKGYNWIIYPIIKQSLKDNSLQFCLTFKKSDKTAFETRYFYEGKLVEDEEVIAFIKSHTYQSGGSKKQEDLGIAAEDIINVRNYKFENVLCIGKPCKELWEELTRGEE